MTFGGLQFLPYEIDSREHGENMNVFTRQGVIISAGTPDAKMQPPAHIC